MISDKHASLLRMSIDELRRYMAELGKESIRLVQMSKEIDTATGKSMIARQEEHLAEHQRAYFNLDVTDYPNIVVAKLAGMIGAEREIRDNIAFYKNIDKKKKELDETVRFCEDMLKARESEESAKRQ